MRSSLASLGAEAPAFALAALLAFVAPAPRALQVAAAASTQAGGAAAAPARPADASALLAAFATMNGLEASYEEEKQLALLAVPLKSRGHLYFMRPGYLARVVEAPEASTLKVSPTELQLADRDGVQRIDLRSNDEVRLFVTSLVQVFLGDEAALKRSFDIAFEPAAESASGWTLKLLPRGAPLDKLMAELRLQGEGFAVGTIEVREPGGDRTVTRILSADTRRTFTDEERTRLFGIPPS